MAKRNRILKGKLVASTDRLRHIASKRLDVEILYVKRDFNYEIIKETILGIKPEMYLVT